MKALINCLLLIPPLALVSCSPVHEIGVPNGSTLPQEGSELVSIKGKELDLILIMKFNSIKVDDAPKAGNIIRTFQFALGNASDKEIAEVDIHMVMRDRKTKEVVHDCGTQTMKSFTSTQIPYVGSLLPGNQTVPLEQVKFEMPSNAWRTDTYESFDVSGVRAYKDPKNMHDIGHLYTLFITSKPEESLAVLKKDPSLCTVSSDLKLTTTHLAFATAGKDVIEYVLEHGGSIKDTTVRGGKVIDYAAFSRDITSLQIAAKEYGVNYVGSNGQTPIYKALLTNNTEAIKWLLANGAKIDIESKDGTTPAMAAVQTGHEHNLELLVKAGADSKKLNSRGYGWYHVATFNYGMLDKLLKYNIPIDQKGPPDENTPLLFAAAYGNLAAVEWFVAHGADPKAKNSHGHTGGDLAKEWNTFKSDRFFNEAVERGLAARKKGSR